MYKKLIRHIFLYSLTINLAYADGDFNQYFQNGLDVASLHQNQANTALKSFDPKSTFPNYTPTPDQSKYYGGVTQGGTTLTTDAANASKTDSTAQSIQSSFNDRPKFVVDPNSPDMQKSELIQNNSVDIVNGISNQFVDCTKKQTCTTTYQTVTCEETPNLLKQFCHKILNINMVPKQTVTPYYFTVKLSTEDHNYAAAIINLVNGQMIDSGPHDASASLSGRLPQGTDCNGLQGKVTSIKAGHIDQITFPSCSTGLNLNIRTSGTFYTEVNFEVDVIQNTLQPEDQWDDQCAGLENNSSCTFQNESCVQPQSTHIIQGVPVTRDCWEKESLYFCGGGSASSTCQTYRDQGCEQIGSVCENKSDGGCMLYQDTFQCPIKQCTDVGVVCNGQTYCITSDCLAHDKQADPNFQKAVSNLSAVHDASKQFDQQFIFKGNSKSCSEAPIGFLNCCADDGWGKEAGLASCSDDEKALGQAKENGQAIYVGEYCKNSVMGICTSKRKSYCVFPSKLARIVQDQGRNEQLHIDFGEKETPDCRGLTPDELQKIDFSKIDFSEFYAYITQKEHIADQGQVTQQISDKIQQMTQGGTPHD